MSLDANLLWWMAVTRIVEDEPEVAQKIFRMRLQGKSFSECRESVIKDGGKMKLYQVRVIEERIKRRIAESLTPPKDEA